MPWAANSTNSPQNGRGRFLGTRHLSSWTAAGLAQEKGGKVLGCLPLFLFAFLSSLSPPPNVCPRLICYWRRTGIDCRSVLYSAMPVQYMYPALLLRMGRRVQKWKRKNRFPAFFVFSSNILLLSSGEALFLSYEIGRQRGEKSFIRSIPPGRRGKGAFSERIPMFTNMGSGGGGTTPSQQQNYCSVG